MAYTPIFRGIVFSSLWREEDYVVKVFLTMLALQDADHVVRMNEYSLSLAANKTESEVVTALEVLSAPDTKRITPQPFEGRRVQKVEDGWLVLNGDEYQTRMKRENEKWGARKRQKDFRAKKRLHNRPTAAERNFEKAYGDGKTEEREEGGYLEE